MAIKHIPVALKVGLFDGVLIADPSLFEEDLLATSLTIVQTADKQLCAVHKPGGAAMSGPQLAECMQLSLKHSITVTAMLTAAVAQAAAAAAAAPT